MQDDVIKRLNFFVQERPGNADIVLKKTNLVEIIKLFETISKMAAPMETQNFIISFLFFTFETTFNQIQYISLFILAHN